MSVEKFLLVIGIAGVINGAVLGIFLMFMRNGNILANRIMGFLLWAAAAKSSYAVLISGVPVPWDFGRYIYLVSQTGYYSLAPLTLLYTLALTRKINRIRWYDSLHFIPAIYMLFAAVNKWFDNVWTGQLQILIYLLISAYVVVTLKGRKRINIISIDFRWLLSLIFAVFSFWVSITVLLLMDTNRYYFVELSILFSIIIYILIYTAIRLYGFQLSGKKVIPGSADINDDKESGQILKKLTDIMEEDKPYENPELSLPKLAGILNTSSHRLSEIINKKTGNNFTDFINSYRVEKAKEMLVDPQYGHYKIAAIAFDCGFNTLSTFNLAFKKHTGETPSAYREKMVLA